MIDVPPVSILNAYFLDVIGQPEVQVLWVDSRLMRWSCLYHKQLHQDDMRVCEFPHDAHNLSLNLGILLQQQPGGRWVQRKWKLALASKSDTLGNIRIPCGLMVDSLAVPGFETDISGLNFRLSELKHGTSTLLSWNMDNDFASG
ncbi:hypothetical protein ACHAW5_000537 [Stephanodiscus triporus]|uniref:Anaphase-promoting complex subunit 1 n=1 Tax=Stephanodiscus triporus TaxID=2934178 RepID=A0ABD3MPC6_9STRA